MSDMDPSKRPEEQPDEPAATPPPDVTTPFAAPEPFADGPQPLPDFEVVSEAPRSKRRSRGKATFDFGGVFSNCFKVYGRMFISIIVLSVIFIAPGSLLGAKLQLDMQQNVDALDTAEGDEFDDEAFDDWFGEMIASTSGLIGLGIVQRIMSMVLSGAIAFLVLRHQQGRPVGIAEAVSRGLSRFFAIAGAMILVTLFAILFAEPTIVLVVLELEILAVVVGIVSAVFFFLWYLSVYCVAPACAVERLGPMESIKRSRQLCVGYRGYVFLLLFVIGMIGGGASMVVQMPFFMSNMESLAQGGTASLGSVLAASASEIFFLAPLGAIAIALVYIELRRIKEGIDPEGIANVFE